MAVRLVLAPRRTLTLLVAIPHHLATTAKLGPVHGHPTAPPTRLVLGHDGGDGGTLGEGGGLAGSAGDGGQIGQ